MKKLPILTLLIAAITVAMTLTTNSPQHMTTTAIVQPTGPSQDMMVLNNELVINASGNITVSAPEVVRLIEPIAVNNNTDAALTAATTTYPIIYIEATGRANVETTAGAMVMTATGGQHDVILPITTGTNVDVLVAINAQPANCLTHQLILPISGVNVVT